LTSPRLTLGQADYAEHALGKSGDAEFRDLVEYFMVVGMEFDVAVSPGPDGKTVFKVDGVLDLQSKTDLLAACHPVLDRPETSGLILDLGSVSFMDSSGLGALIELNNEAIKTGRSFAIRDPSKGVARILEITGLTDIWNDGSGLG
jgi:anti-anti-sigma factor